MKTDSSSLSQETQCEGHLPPKRTIYVLIRTDIPLEQQLVQACHAAAEGGRAHYEHHALHGIASLVALAVSSRADLLAARARLGAKGIETTLFFEPDFGIGDSALCTAPLLDAQRKHLRSWCLWRPRLQGGDKGSPAAASSSPIPLQPVHAASRDAPVGVAMACA